MKNKKESRFSDIYPDYEVSDGGGESSTANPAMRNPPFMEDEIEEGSYEGINPHKEGGDGYEPDDRGDGIALGDFGSTNFRGNMFEGEKGMSWIKKLFESQLEERCWDGYEPVPGKKAYEKGSCRKKEESHLFDESFWEGNEEEELTLEGAVHGVMGSLEEAEYKGRKVQLNKPMRGDVKKFKVFVKDPKTGNVKKVNFGDKDMRIKKSNPKNKKSFRARHKCDKKKDKTTAGYWSCRMWEGKSYKKEGAMSDLDLVAGEIAEQIRQNYPDLNENVIDMLLAEVRNKLMSVEEATAAAGIGGIGDGGSVKKRIGEEELDEFVEPNFKHIRAKSRSRQGLSRVKDPTDPFEFSNNSPTKRSL